MVDILSAVPLSIGGIISLLISSVIAFVGLVIADKVIAHGIEAKKLFFMALIALFVTPIIGSLIFSMLALPGFVGAYLLPIAIWIILGEVMLSAGMKTKLTVAAVGYILYVILSIFVAPYIVGLIPF
jgi:hypothetical protein